MDDIIPLWVVNALAFITVFSVMTSTGTTVHQLTAGNIIVPAIGFAATFAFDFSLPEQVGVVLMAIADWKISDFKAACAYAASQGWLIVEEDALTLTVGLAAA